MNKEIPQTIFTPIKKPVYSTTKKSIEKIKYLDNFYTKDWLNNYFTVNTK